MYSEFGLKVTAFNIGERFVGIQEVRGSVDNPQVMAMLRLDNRWPQHDETPWCSAYVNYVCWLLSLPRSKSLRARSWLGVGRSISVYEGRPEFDVVVLKRGRGKQPGPDVIKAPGHVGFYAGIEGTKVLVLGGNQGDEVNVRRYPISRVLGTRRLVG